MPKEPVIIDRPRREVWIKGKPINLTYKEFEILHLIHQAGGVVMTRQDLVNQVWGKKHRSEVDERTVDQHVSRIRIKFGKAGRHIVTVTKVGYKYSAN